MYFEEIVFKEYRSPDMVGLDFVVHAGLDFSATIRDTREKIKSTHILLIHSEAEKKAMIKGFRFLADTLEKSNLDERR
jgi:hypothetical protein